MTGSYDTGSFGAALTKFARRLRGGHFPLVKILIFLLLTGCLTLLTPHGGAIDISYTVGNIWVDKDLISPFPFPILKEQKGYERELSSAGNSVAPVFRRRQSGLGEAADSLGSLLASISAEAVRLGVVRAAPARTGTAEAPVPPPFPLSDEEWSALAAAGKGTLAGLRSFLDDAQGRILPGLEQVYQAGILDSDHVKQRHASIALREGNREVVQSIGRVYEPSEARSVIAARASAVRESPAGQVLARAVLSVLRPNLEYDPVETSRLVQAARDNVPRSVGFVQENERIIGKHERITDEAKLKLDSYLRAKAEREIDTGAWRFWAGNALHVGVLLTLFAIYLALFRRGVYRDNGKLLLIALIILMEGVMAWVTVRAEISQPLQFLILVPAASMLLTILFDSRIGFYGTVVIAFVVAGVRGNDYGIALASLVAGGLAAYTVRDIRKRTQIFRSLVFVFLGYAISIIALGFEQLESFGTIGTRLTFAFANAVFSPVVTYGLLIFFERAFRVATDLTLLELSDINHPLLRQLSEKAPGTFHHSMVLGNMAESAAEAIGANPILARVGAYYHDIGKSVKPEYFVENQIGQRNRHTRLRPRMSALIIASHVKEGVELGREHGLPEKIVDFIEQHHGTNRISFFYEKALRQAARKSEGGAVHEDDFRYPGPKPQSKEAGIVMLADSVEASMRSVDHLTPPRMEEHIDEMIRQRFVEGQLDECELTLRDLSKIREAFLKILVGIHHQRIRYDEGAESAETPERTAVRGGETTAGEAGEPASAPPPDDPSAGDDPTEEAEATGGEAGSGGEADPRTSPGNPGGEASRP